jgi:succinyl-CoA synthetase beta subunit
MIVFSAGGGTGIEERAAATRRIACDVNGGPLKAEVKEAAESCGLPTEQAAELGDSIRKLFSAARTVEARSLEINPLVLTKGGEFVAADCRLTIDDYAVARHPELKIEIAREFDHPPTELEQIAYAVEQNEQNLRVILLVPPSAHPMVSNQNNFAAWMASGDKSSYFRAQAQSAIV